MVTANVLDIPEEIEEVEGGIHKPTKSDEETQIASQLSEMSKTEVFNHVELKVDNREEMIKITEIDKNQNENNHQSLSKDFEIAAKTQDLPKRVTKKRMRLDL